MPNTYGCEILPIVKLVSNSNIALQASYFISLNLVNLLFDLGLRFARRGPILPFFRV